MPFKLAVSIINYRTAALTLACVESALADLAEVPNGCVVVVDNASGDGSAEIIADWIAAQPAGTPVHFVASDVNTGFSGGHNLGMAAVDAEYYLPLNSDSILRPGCLATLLAAAEAHPRHGLFCPRIETEDGEAQVNCFRFASIASELIRGAQTAPVTKLFAHRVVALIPPVQNEQIEWASFACILLRAKMVREVGAMDEGYFLYFEDAEYCLRARRAGWHILHVPEAIMVHFRGGSGPVKAMQKAKKRLPPYYYASRTRFFWHRYGRFGPIAANAAWYGGRGIAQLRRIFGKAVNPPVQHEAADVWVNALRPNGPRRAPHEAP